ncbi:MAG: MFS transporter, partial [Gemmatimonadetes bacterium]|nr:MFS transporter [Gemmatimonadota bacterium]
RDALLADSVPAGQRGWACGVHRAADTAGAVVGLLLTLWVVDATQGGGLTLEASTFRRLVLWSLMPAFLAVLLLAVGARDIPPAGASAGAARKEPPRIAFRALGPRFGAFLLASAVFQTGNSSDAFLILRAQERGLGVLGLLWMLLAFNVVYTAVSAPAGALADRVPRKWVLLGGWCVYAAVYLGFAVAQTTLHVVVLFAVYGVYMGLVGGAAKALVADLVAPELRATAFGTYDAVVGLLSLPASLLAGLLWQGFRGWSGFGPSAPFAFGAAMAAVGALMLVVAVPEHPPRPTPSAAP